MINRLMLNFLVMGSVLIYACQEESNMEPIPATEVESTEEKGLLLAKFELSAGHEIYFEGFPSGDILMSESGTIDRMEEQVPFGDSQSLLERYLTLAPKELPVPEMLLNSYEGKLEDIDLTQRATVKQLSTPILLGRAEYHALQVQTESSKCSDVLDCAFEYGGSGGPYKVCHYKVTSNSHTQSSGDRKRTVSSSYTIACSRAIKVSHQRRVLQGFSWKWKTLNSTKHTVQPGHWRKLSYKGIHRERRIVRTKNSGGFWKGYSRFYSGSI